MEDSPVNQQVARGLLELPGHSVVVANDGKEALNWRTRQPFDGMLMDLQMPYMVGFEAIRAICELEQTTGVSWSRYFIFRATSTHSEE